MITWLRFTGIVFGVLGVLINLSGFPIWLYRGADSPIIVFLASVSLVFMLIAALCITISIRVEGEENELP